MALSPDISAGTQSPGEIRPSEPKPVTHRVFVDPAKSVVDLCKEAEVILRFNPYKLGEWPSAPFDHDNKGKPKTNGAMDPYTTSVSDGSDTVKKKWDEAIAGRAKDQKGTTFHEGIALVRAHPEILDSRRLVLSGASCGMYDVVQLTKRHGKVEARPLFVGDTNKEHLKKKHKKLPFAVIFSSGKTPEIPNL